MSLMGTVVSALVVGLVGAFGVFGARHLFRVAAGKDGCCGGGTSGGSSSASRRSPRASRVVVADTDPAHYPFTTELTIRGMTCEHCRDAVTDSLNALPGTWATVDLDDRTATVRTKAAPDLSVLEQAVEDAGYSVIRW